MCSPTSKFHLRCCFHDKKLYKSNFLMAVLIQTLKEQGHDKRICIKSAMPTQGEIFVFVLIIIKYNYMNTLRKRFKKRTEYKGKSGNDKLKCSPLEEDSRVIIFLRGVRIGTIFTTHTVTMHLQYKIPQLSKQWQTVF